MNQNSTEKVSVIICAAGKGTRAGFSKNKILQPILGIPVLERTLCAFFSANIDEIVVAASPCDFDEISPLCQKYGATLTEGGETRLHSVYAALKKATSSIVLIHDGARPFINTETIKRCIESVKEFGSGVCAIPATDTLATADKNGNILSYPDRKSAYQIQTPQGFYLSEISAAYKKAFAEKRFDFTDDSSVFAAYIRAPHLCAGNRENIKLTYATDFQPVSSRVGFGIDTHAFGKVQDYIMLGGVKIPSETGLIAHSDGDVLCHAVCDALLSAAGLYDIGHYFPDTDTKWENADSMKMLSIVLSSIKEQGFLPLNLSVAIQAEKPRLAPYIDKIKISLSDALCIPLHAIGISAGTNEKLGYIGKGKGITVHAAVLLKSVN